MKTALIAWGGWAGHEPEACAAVVAQMLTEAGYEVSVEAGTSGFADPELGHFDLIVPVITMSTIERHELDGLVAAVEAGTGLAGFHGGMGDTFRNETRYQFMVGGQFVAHPGNIIDYQVRISQPEHELVAGIGDFAYRSEQYHMHVDPGNEVLATTVSSGAHSPWTKGTVLPVVWTRRYGRAKIFYSALGHVAEEFEVPQMREILRRGLIWATR